MKVEYSKTMYVQDLKERPAKGPEPHIYSGLCRTLRSSCGLPMHENECRMDCLAGG